MSRIGHALKRPRRLNAAAIRRPRGFYAAVRLDPWQTGGLTGTRSLLVEDMDDTIVPALTGERAMPLMTLSVGRTR